MNEKLYLIHNVLIISFHKKNNKKDKANKPFAEFCTKMLKENKTKVYGKGFLKPFSPLNNLSILQ